MKALVLIGCGLLLLAAGAFLFFFNTTEYEAATNVSDIEIDVDGPFPAFYFVRVALRIAPPLPETIKKMAESHPHSAPAQYNLGVWYHINGNHTDALTQFDLALSIDPQYPLAKVAMARLQRSAFLPKELIPLVLLPELAA